METLRPRPRAHLIAGCLVALALLDPGTGCAARLTILDDCSQPRVSPDGSVVAAISGIGMFSRLLVWRGAQDVQFVDLDVPCVSCGAFVLDLSADGSVVVGGKIAGWDISDGDWYEAFRWSRLHGVERLHPFYEVEREGATGLSVSRDGLVVAGHQTGYTSAVAVPMRWIDGGAATLLGDLPAGYANGGVVGTSFDGSTVFGWLTEGPWWDPKTFFRWTAEDGYAVLPPETPFLQTQAVIDVTPDGKVWLAYGWRASDDNWVSYLWREGGGRQDIENPPANIFHAYAIRADAGAVVGSAGHSSWIWTPGEGLRPLLEAAGDTGSVMEGWEDKGLPTMSDDGSVFAFEISRIFPLNGRGCAILQLPEPRSPLAVPAALVVLTLVRWSSRRRAPAVEPALERAAMAPRSVGAPGGACGPPERYTD